MRFPGYGVVLSCVLLAAGVARAEAVHEAPWLRLELREDASPLDGLRLSPEREQEVLSANEGFIDVLLRIESRRRADGLEEETVTQVRRFLSDEGVEQGGNLELRVMPSHMSAVIERAYVLLPDGSRIGIDSPAIQILPDVIPRVFSNVRRVVVPLPGLTREATAVFVYRTVFRVRDWPFPIASQFHLGAFHPVERLELAFSWDPALTTPHWATNDPELTCHAADRTLRCTRDRIAAANVDPDLRSYFDETPGLVVAEPTSWSELAARVRGVVEARISEGLPPGALEKILGDATTSEQRWQRIFDFAANEIRYLGLEHGSSAVVPRAPSTTLQRRYGDCKDKVSLMIALARAAGIDAYAALTSTERFDASRLQLPSSSYFDHMVACRDRTDGVRECVDPTVTGASPEDSIAMLGGAVMLALRDGAGAPEQIERRRFASELEIEQETKVACDGRRDSSLTRRLQGLAGVSYRQSLAAMSPQEQKRALGDEYRQLVSTAMSPSFGIRGLKDAGRAIEISTQTSTPPSSPLGANPDMMDSDIWTVYHGISLRSDNRHFSYLNPGARIRSILRYEACPGLKPRFMGAQLDLSSAYGRFERSYATEGSSVIVSSTFEVPSGRVSASEVPAFNQFLETALDQADIWFQLGEK